MPFRHAGRDDRGATAVEYGLIVALIAVVVIGAVVVLGGNVGGLFAGAANAVGNPTADEPPSTDPCATATAGDNMATCNSLGEWSCPNGYTLAFAGGVYTCSVNVVTRLPYTGATPTSPAARNFGNSGGSVNLDNVSGVIYSVASCTGRTGACAKLSLSGRVISAGNDWANSAGNFDYADMTVSWVVPQTDTVEGASGQITVSIN